MILSKTYSDSYGGLVVDMKTNKVICELNPDVEEILVLEGIDYSEYP